MIVAWEKLSDVLREPNLRELILDHFEEAGCDHNDCPLDVDFDRLLTLESLGMLKLITGRIDGALVGYMVWYLQKPIDFKSTLHAIQGPWNMAGLYAKSLPGLKELGVKRVVSHIKNHVAADRGTLASVIERAGARETERVYYQVL